MATYCNIKFTVTTKNATEEVYLVGNTKSLGAWDVNKAVKMTKVDANIFTLTKRFNTNDNVEYKVIATTNWENVEKGIFAEEVENHHFVAEKGHFEDIYVHSFN